MMKTEKFFMAFAILAALLSDGSISAADGGKDQNHLRRYAKAELDAPEDKLVEVMKARLGDFGLPENPFENKELAEFLKYSADHYRVAYLHLGKEPSPENLSFYWTAGALRDLWSLYGDERARRRYELILRHALRNIEKMSDSQIQEKIDRRGLMNLWHPIMKSAAKYYADLYKVSGNEADARRVCLILKRFGEVADDWKIYRKTPDGVSVISLDKPVPADTDYGLWGWWGDVHDLNAAMPLLEAYMLVRDSKSFAGLSDTDKKIITDKLLCGLAEKNLLFKFRPLHNQNMSRIDGLARFGKLLGKPEYVHTALRWIRDIIHTGFYSDGAWCEGTSAYGFPVAKGIIRTAEYLKGWSDPAGYIDPNDKTHMENFDTEREFGHDFARIKHAFDLLALPDGRSVAFEDSVWDARNMFFGGPPSDSKPFLLGAAGKGMLGFGDGKNQVRLYSQWEGANNHDHYSGLGIVLWADGEETASETGYRGNRDWNISTAAHNTVVVDEKNQNGSGHKIKGVSDCLPLYPEYKRNEIWGARACYDDAGTLKLWDTTETDIQIAEIDGNKFYDLSAGTEIYSRTLALVRLGGERFYILDIFRVKGGKTHDYMLHGNLAKKYRISLSADGQPLKLSPEKIKLGKFLESSGSTGNFSGDFAAEFSEGDGPVLRTLFAGGLKKDIIIADGPAIRLDSEPSAWGKPGNASPVETKNGKTSEFLCVRHAGPETMFIAAQEVYRKGEKPVVKAVEPLKINSPDTFDAGVKVTLEDGREDIIISSLTGSSDIKYGDISFAGSLLHAVTEGGTMKKITVFGAEKFSGDKFNLDKPSIHKGAVYSVESKSRGDKDNSFTVEGAPPDKEALKGESIIIFDGEKRAHPYIISRIENSGGGKSKVIVDTETGFIMDNESMTMLYYPCWRIPGKPGYIINGKHVFKTGEGH